jgi:hypothetical protein
VAGIGVALVAALVWMPPKIDTDNYSTLATQRAPAGDIDIVFVQSITAADMHAVLDEIGAKIAAGPSDVGRYTVRLQHTHDDAAIAALLERLHNDPRVRFAGRTLAPDSGP